MAQLHGARLTSGPYNTLAPTGTTQATAATINADTVMMTGGTAGGGIILKPMELTSEAMVVNGDASVEYYVYPQVGGKINNATANLGINVSPNRAIRFRAINNLDVIAFF